MTNTIIRYVNKTGQDIRGFDPIFEKAYVTGELDCDYRDIFSIKFLKGYNSDGSDRMIIDMVED